MTMHLHKFDKGGELLVEQKMPRRQKAGGSGEHAVPGDEARLSDLREKHRQPLQGAVFSTTWRGRTRAVEVSDLSGGGAMITCDMKPALGDHVLLHLSEDAPVECVVRWVKEGRIGLEFAHETQLHCSRDEQQALLREVIQKFPHPKKQARPGARKETADQRGSNRHPLIWAGTLLSGPSSWKVRLRNVSEVGALIQCAGGPTQGKDVILDLGPAGSVDATVAWAVGDHLGLRFEEPFEMKRLAQTKPKVAPATWLRPFYLVDDVPASSAWDDAWSRMSITDLRDELEGFLGR